MYNVLKNSIKPNLPQRTAMIALSRADQLTAARDRSSASPVDCNPKFSGQVILNLVDK